MAYENELPGVERTYDVAAVTELKGTVREVAVRVCAAAAGPSPISKAQPKVEKALNKEIIFCKNYSLTLYTQLRRRLNA